MGEHDQPDAEEAQKFDVEQLLFAGLDVGVGVSFVMGKPSLLIYLRLNHTMNGEEGKGLWGRACKAASYERMASPVSPISLSKSMPVCYNFFNPMHSTRRNRW